MVSWRRADSIWLCWFILTERICMGHSDMGNGQAGGSECIERCGHVCYKERVEGGVVTLDTCRGCEFLYRHCKGVGGGVFRLDKIGAKQIHNAQAKYYQPRCYI